MKFKKVKSLSHVQLFATPWTVTYQVLNPTTDTIYVFPYLQNSYLEWSKASYQLLFLHILVIIKFCHLFIILLIRSIHVLKICAIFYKVIQNDSY